MVRAACKKHSSSSRSCALRLSASSTSPSSEAPLASPHPSPPPPIPESSNLSALLSRSPTSAGLASWMVCTSFPSSVTTKPRLGRTAPPACHRKSPNTWRFSRHRPLLLPGAAKCASIWLRPTSSLPKANASGLPSTHTHAKAPTERAASKSSPFPTLTLATPGSIRSEPPIKKAATGSGTYNVVSTPAPSRHTPHREGRSPESPISKPTGMPPVQTNFALSPPPTLCSVRPGLRGSKVATSSSESPSRCAHSVCAFFTSLSDSFCSDFTFGGFRHINNTRRA
eukprot:scaffold143108_cov32-Tisochrysis_lutea.AAC.2